MALSVVVLVGESQAWIPDLVRIAAKLKVGAGVEPDTDVCPLISVAAKQRVESLIGAGIAAGATCVLDGRGVVVRGYEKGNFVGPTILTNVTTENPAYTEEVFGPVLVCMAAKTMEEALTLVNGNKYGNSGVLFTNSGLAARRFQRDVNCGQVRYDVLKCCINVFLVVNSVFDYVAISTLCFIIDVTRIYYSDI